MRQSPEMKRGSVVRKCVAIFGLGHGVFGIIPGLYSLDASSIPPPGVTAQNISRHHSMFPRGWGMGELPPNWFASDLIPRDPGRRVGMVTQGWAILGELDSLVAGMLRAFVISRCAVTLSSWERPV